LFYGLAIVFFTFFYTALTFDSKDTADKLRKSGGFIPGIPASSTTKAGRNGIAEILLKMALNTKNLNQINRSIDHNSTSLSVSITGSIPLLLDY
jgi:preprotein translocase subunit SecY